jgi:GH35 family endo-1,4-beta-xylanase
MAELDAVSKKILGVTPTPTLNADGSSVIRFTGNATYPNAKALLTAPETVALVKGLTPAAKPPPLSLRRVGVKVTYKQLKEDPTFVKFILANVDSITAAWEMKWGPMQRNRAEAEFMAAFAREHKISLRLHAALWHQEGPVGYPTDRAGATAAVIARVKDLVSLGKGIPDVCCDVVNEMRNDDGTPRQSWLLAPFGNNEQGLKELLVIAFTAGREADRLCRLYDNEFGLIEYSDPAKAAAVHGDIVMLDEHGLIDGLGCQYHPDSAPTVTEPQVRAFIAQQEALELDTQFTEIALAGNQAGPCTVLLQAAATGCTRMTFWGARKGEWDGGAAANAEPWNEDYSPTANVKLIEAWHAGGHVEEPPPPPPPASKTIVGVNGASLKAAQILGVGIKSERLTFAPYSLSFEGQGGFTLAQSRANGFAHQIVTVGNIDDGSLLANVNQAVWLEWAMKQLRFLEENGVEVADVVNEYQFKGGHCDPVSYSKLYVLLAKAKRAAGLKIRLAYTILGSYQRADGSWSDIAKGTGPQVDATKANPELAALVDCLLHHCYGRAAENIEGNHGTKALELDRADAVKCGMGGDVYVDECGMQYSPGAARDYKNEPTEAGQATSIEGVLKAGASLSYVKGMWPYAVQDGHWAFTPAAITAIGAVARANS